MEWLPSWATTIQRTEQNNLPPALNGKTLRQYIYPSFSGSQIRIQLSNERGNGPVEISKVHIAMGGGGGGQMDAATDTAFTFDGNDGVTIPQGETAWSDPVDFELKETELTAVSILFGSAVPSDITGHPGARTTSHVGNGDVVSEASMGSTETRDRWYFIDAIEVMAPTDCYAAAVLGDSITDGYGVLNEFGRWPDFMTLHFKEDPMLADKVSVLNFGMGANNLTISGADQDSGLVRFERDVLKRPKIKWLLVLEGVNDIGGGVAAAPITSAYHDIIERSHEVGILVYGIPLLPIGNSSYASGETTKNQVNDWINTSGEFDAVLPLDEAVADPNNPSQQLQSLTNDFLHPNIQGYEAMGRAVDRSLFYNIMQ